MEGEVVSDIVKGLRRGDYRAQHQQGDSGIMHDGPFETCQWCHPKLRWRQRWWDYFRHIGQAFMRWPR